MNQTARIPIIPMPVQGTKMGTADTAPASGADMDGETDTGRREIRHAGFSRIIADKRI